MTRRRENISPVWVQEMGRKFGQYFFPLSLPSLVLSGWTQEAEARCQSELAGKRKRRRRRKKNNERLK